MYRFFIILIAFGLTGCSGSRSAYNGPGALGMEALFIPAGVDSSVAAYADSLARVSFVSIEAQEQAATRRDSAVVFVDAGDSLWMYLEMTRDSGTVSEDLAEAALRAANQAAVPLNEFIQLTQATEIDSLTLLRRQEVLLNEAQDALEEAIQLNPYDLQTSSVLARVYTAQAQRLGQNNAYHEAVDVLEKLTRLRPDQHTLFVALGNNYYQLKQWDNASINYQRAEAVYLATYDLVAENPPSAPDSSLLFQYVTRQADVHIYQRDASAAIAAFQRAETLASSQEEMDFVTGELDWISWDNGNVRSSLARDSLITLEQAGQLPEAESGFVNLRQQLSRPEAIDEVEWRLSTVQYRLGKGAEAAERMLSLIQRLPDPNSASVDSTLIPYFDTFGTICFNQAMLFLGERRDNRTALKYLQQAVQFPWKDRPRAHLEAAKLLRSNVNIALEHGQSALEEQDQLSAPEQKELFGLMATLYRTTGNFEEARKYLQQYRAMP